MRKTQLPLVIGLVIAAAVAPAVGAPAAHDTLSNDARSVAATVKRDAKVVGTAVKHAAVKVGAAAKQFGLKVADATKQGARELHDTDSKDSTKTATH